MRIIFVQENTIYIRMYIYINNCVEVGNDAETDGKIINVSSSRARQDSRLAVSTGNFAELHPTRASSTVRELN